MIQFQKGDYATIFGELYVEFASNDYQGKFKRFNYSMSMQAEYFDLNNVQFLSMILKTILGRETFH